MAYHTKKRRTRARKHTLRSRRRTRGGEGKRKRMPQAVRFPARKLETLLESIRKDLTTHANSPVQFSEQQKDAYKYIYERNKGKKDAIMTAINKYKRAEDKEYSKWLINEFFNEYERETKNER